MWVLSDTMVRRRTKSAESDCEILVRRTRKKQLVSELGLVVSDFMDL